MNKVELQAKLDSLADELNFLRNLYETVSVQQNGMECGAGVLIGLKTTLA